MRHDEYKLKRQALIDEAQALINEGKFDESAAKAAEVKALDDQWDAQAKAQADLAALSGQQRGINMQNVAGVQIQNAVPAGVMGAERPMTMEDALKSDDYTNAWAKTLMGKQNQISAAEAKAFSLVNDGEAVTDNTHYRSTEGLPILIPANVSERIIRKIEELHPFVADITKTMIKGNLTLIMENTSTEAGWYEETTATTIGKETIKQFTLGGCELARAIKVSWAMKEMSIPDFISFIVENMSKRMGDALAIGVVAGHGARSGYATEPTGILTALAKSDNSAQVVTGGISFDNICKALGKIPAAYPRLTVYANRKTIYEQLYTLEDSVGRPIFIPDTVNGGVYKLLGNVVKEEAAMPDGQLLICDAAAAYHLNMNKPITLSTDEDILTRTVVIAGYAIADGNLKAPLAAALVKNS